jgi:phosphatidylserine/phosphatidylglycerophosphate/cardiolipin synthase-like enzyme
MKTSLFLTIFALSCLDQESTPSTTKPSASESSSTKPSSSKPIIPTIIPNNTITNSKWYVGFSPNGKCTDYVSNLILSAKKSVRMLAYSFTSEEISKALVDAGKKGIDVQIVLDRSDLTGKGSKVQYVYDSGVVKVYIDSKHAIAHNKVIIVDGEDSNAKIETGSFNFTSNAQHSNAENCIFLENTDIAKEYETNWQLHMSHSTLFNK